jgi:hypothetical protein
MRATTPEWILAFVATCWFSSWLTLQLIAAAESVSSENACFSRNATHYRVKACLSAGRPAGECLLEARALCLQDLATAGGR